ncbi:MAG: enoyl-CoA hydratase/isomerase family protein [Candidatus Lokiarchaeota archaeon]|nr:enoyl-CoA hydratase/isomerase family protein [Candidatus Lokiarchaeota archaeon]
MQKMSDDRKEKLILEIKRKVGILTLNNGDLNVFDTEFIYLVRDALKQLKNDQKANVILIKSASDRAFSAGFDLKSISQVNQEIIDIFLKDGYEILELLHFMPKPVISLINGYSIGVGFLFPLACEFRFCTKDAKFQLPEVNFGDLMFPTHGGCTTLPRVVSKLSDAYYIAMTGERIDAETALKMGVIDRMFETKEEMLKQGFEFAKLIASKSPMLIGMIKAAIRKNLNSSIADGFALEREGYDIIRNAQDPNREEKKDKFIEKNIKG